MTNRSEAELMALRKAADLLARERRERVNTIHLLAALCGQAGPVAELLGSRRLEQATIVKAARNFDEELGDAITDALGAARELGRRAAVPSAGSMRSSRNGTRSTAAPEPGGLHLLVALLSNRRFAAVRALGHLGIDVSRLRMAALQMAFGVVPPVRAVRTALEPARGSTPKAPGASLRSAPPAGTAPAGAGGRSLLGRDAGRSTARQGEPEGREPVAQPTARRRGSPRSQRAPSRAGSAVQVPLFPPTESHSAEPASAPRPATRAAVPTKPARPVAPAKTVSQPARTDDDAAQRFELDRADFPTLAALGRNLTLAAARGELEPVVGREPEVDQALDVLAKHHANCALLVGPPGVGKTSVARGIAQRFAAAGSHASPRLLIELSATDLLAGTGSRGTLAERAAALRAEARKANGRIVLFLDEIQDLVAMPAADELVAELKGALDRGELPLVAATSTAGLRRTIEADAVLARRFTLVEVEEPDEEEAFVLLRSVADVLERHHAVRYTDESIAATVAWSMRYLQGRALPDKAVAVLDLAGSRVHRHAEGRAASSVEPAAVAEVVSEQAGVPVERLLQSDRERMLGLESYLADRVVGHADALARIATALRRNAAGLRTRRPIGSFLLLGPTGVGKTETAKAVAEALFNSSDAMTRLDMSEYSESHAVARLIGAPPGYVGHEAGGELTEAVRRRPYQVVLLDEIEKAHRDVLQAFLQVLDEGRLTDGRGRCTDLTNTVIVLTSNLGSADLQALGRERRVGFATGGRQGADRARSEEVAIGAAKKALPPELYNRLDEVIVYAPLSAEDVREIAERQLQSLAASLLDRDIRLMVEPAVLGALMRSGGYEPEYGARPMRRAIARLVEGPLAELLLDGELGAGSTAAVRVDGRGDVRVEPLPAGAAGDVEEAVGA